ncbi:hypothetical protein ACTI_49630 [Actinoplanes sp. OR16]|uniref:GNAT family N-acetyltransferase n=1 Tax=Actinoplanes sp. OR16 TaxID=946334 RepID=UPI000F6B7B3E|nr:GNAT family N-acetyltransferase [Actinoplanes sp. OR16]BBH68278.1 hypothetical protein ACTI_49630 [Actinoplanes sp. OR16]
MRIREAHADDLPFLERILLDAYNWSEPRFTLDRLRTDAMARRYLDGFPAAGDLGVIALIGDEPVGAVWGRALPADRAGYGFVAADVPELTVGVLPEARRRGVASRLMTAVVDIAKRRGVPGLSLSVEDGNTARRLYESFGFEAAGRSGGSDTMLLTLSLPLAGGLVSDVVRVGETVRKSPPRDPEFVRALLRHFERHDWPGAPRFLGTDDRGREMLGFIDGDVPWQPGHEPPSIRSDESLAAVARMVRRFHDLTAGTDLAGGQEVVCHNDLSPKNTVYRDLPVAFIDWDLAAPGARIHDVAHVCWQYVGLGPGVRDAAEAARLVRVIADAYGLVNRSALVDTILWWQDRCRRGIEAGAGDPATARLRESGAAEAVQAAYDWTLAHQDLLRRAVS